MTDNAKQIAYWNEVAGPKWVRLQGAMEARLVDIEDRLLAHAKPRSGETILEIGCGTGTTTLRLSDAVGPTGHVTAIDVSRPMLDAARIRLAAARNVTLREADAANSTFDQPFDLLTSRFGIMFFENPAAAFANLHRALKPGGRLVAVAWAPIADNPHWSIPLALATERLGPSKPRPPHAPGPLAFDDPAYVRTILSNAGFTHITIEAESATIIGKSLDDEADIAAIMGPAGALLDEKQADPATRHELRTVFRAALPSYADADARMRATTHIISAHRAFRSMNEESRG